ncbi:MAG: acyl-CoA/acyl-ACP dehydrogenase [Proteobacteria bacterium]|nr:acyl-CoA/acyl-ACP dehydrogenase [Pseudomonadota bacterium]
MATQNLDIEISKETKAMLKEVAKFTGDLLRVSGVELDKVENFLELTKEDSSLWKVFKAYRELDLHLLHIPSDMGGVDGLEGVTPLLIKEQMGYADVGLAMSLLVSDIPFIYAAKALSPELQKLAGSYCEDRGAKMIGCLIMKDHPHAGSPLNAVKEKDSFLLNGIMERVANGNIATHALIHNEFSKNGEETGAAIAVIPLDLPGIKRGEPLNKMGQRSLNQGSITFKNVRISAAYLLTDDRVVANQMKKSIAVMSVLDTGILYSGLAMAALDEARKYAIDRIQGGVPIIEHKNIKLKLFKLFQMVESSRAYARRIANYQFYHPLPPQEVHAAALKCMATQTASEVSSEVIQIFGGNGLAKEYPVEKLFRDAQTGLVENGVNDWLAIRAADYL